MTDSPKHTQDAHTPTKRWVRYSTKASRAAGQVSVLAVVETVFCVCAYWGLWLWFGVTWHHWLIVVATPLVLMRSEQSVVLGVKWFEGYFNAWEGRPKHFALSLFVLLVSVVCVSLAIWHITHDWLSGRSGWALWWRSAALFFLSVNFAIAVLGAIGPTNSATIPLISVLSLGGSRPLISLGSLASMWLRAVATRSVVTCYYVVPGVRAIPQNWRYIVWQSDFLDPPELLPGHEKTAFANTMARYLDSWKSEWTAHFFFFSVMVLFYLPAILWRWSIKSTAWFYLPLLWVGRGWQNIHGHALQVWAKAYAQTHLNRLGLGLAAIGLVASGFALFMPLEFLKLSARLEAAGAPMSPVGYLLVLDWAELLYQPWKWFFLAGWLLTIALYFMLDHHAKHIKAGADADALEPTFRFWMWLSNLRYVLTNLGLLVALVWFLHAVGAPGQLRALFS